MCGSFALFSMFIGSVDDRAKVVHVISVYEPGSMRCHKQKVQHSVKDLLHHVLNDQRHLILSRLNVYSELDI